MLICMSMQMRILPRMPKFMHAPGEEVGPEVKRRYSELKRNETNRAVWCRARVMRKVVACLACHAGRVPDCLTD